MVVVHNMAEDTVAVDIRRRVRLVHTDRMAVEDHIRDIRSLDYKEVDRMTLLYKYIFNSKYVIELLLVCLRT